MVNPLPIPLSSIIYYNTKFSLIVSKVFVCTWFSRLREPDSEMVVMMLQTALASYAMRDQSRVSSADAVEWP